jgi:hypothetical protein
MRLGGGIGSRAGRWLALVAITLSVGLLLGELVVRASGRRPWSGMVRPKEPQLYVEDPELGWRLRPGRYSHPGYTPGSEALRIHVLPDGSRDAGYTGSGGEPWLALLGGSFVQGWGLSDEQTLAWELQKHQRGWRVANHGVGGYGTHQSLLVLERLLAGQVVPSLVLYGFIPLHEPRNVADAGWLESLARAGRGSLVAAPSATLDAEGELVRHEPRRHPRWPLREWSALATFGELLTARSLAEGRSEQARDVTLQLLAAMNRISVARGARFAVVFLWTPPGARVPYREGADPHPRVYRGDLYASALRAEGVPMLDCSHEITPELAVPGEGHPGAELNDFWAACVSEWLDATAPRR